MNKIPIHPRKPSPGELKYATKGVKQIDLSGTKPRMVR